MFSSLIIRAVLFFFGSSVVFWTFLGFGEKPLLVNTGAFSRAVYDAEGRLLHLSLSSDEKYRLWTPLEEISSELIEATLLHEDRYFYYHPGVNPIALLRAVFQTYVLKTRRIGASTISMQLARVRFGIDSRTVSGKIAQILRALEIERNYSKEDILEAYLNLVSYGGNVEGVGAASLIYFAKEASELSTLEALSLAVIPQSPRRRQPRNETRRSKRKRGLLAARDRLLKRWQDTHPYDPALETTSRLPFSVFGKKELPFVAPHFTRSVLNKDVRRSAVSNNGRIKSSLSQPLQEVVEQVVENYIARRGAEGIRNASVLLVENTSMEIKSLVGSAGFFNSSILGQVDGTKAKRSPGSTLKPFVYALAIDQGLIHPRSLLKDAPISLSSYAPENADGLFSGPLSAEDALVRSRNIPAISLANRLRSPDLYEFLEEAGIHLSQSRDYYGLALALGGVEVTMESLAMLYSMLANGGELRSLRMQSGDRSENGKRVLSRESSHLVLEMLEKNPRPNSVSNREEGFSRVSWKTGTSYGYRDAWAAGIFDNYTLVVWVGNFDGSPDPILSGRKAAGPLFFEVIDALREKGEVTRALFRSELLNLASVDVCKVSGKIPTRHCAHRRKASFIPGVSPIAKCDIHREILIDAKSGLRSCQEHQETARKEIFEFWSSDLLMLFEKSGIPREVPPPFILQCEGQVAYQGMRPQITSPERRVVYSMRSSQLGTEKIPLVAVTETDTKEVYWFVNKAFVGKSSVRKALLWPSRPGEFMIHALDELGRSSSRGLRVELVD